MVLGGSVICVGGVFLFHFGIFSALSLQAMTLAASIGNSYWPKLREMQAQKKLAADNDQVIDLDTDNYQQHVDSKAQSSREAA